MSHEAYGLPSGYLLPGPGLESLPAAFAHQLGDTIRIFPNEPPSRVIDRYHGAFGAVYVCEEVDTREPRVFKTPRNDLNLSAAVMEEFADEATTWWSLPDHPLILSAHRILSYNQVPYVHIDHVPRIGTLPPSLASIVELWKATGRSIDLGTVGIIIGQILEGLTFIERTDPSFIHGDIKPSNVLIVTGRDNSGPYTLRHIKLTDFGMSHFRSAERKGRYLGDVSYIGPEIYQMLPETIRDLSPAQLKALDVYALGCTAFEAIFRARWQVFSAELGAPLTLGDLGIEPVIQFEKASIDGRFGKMVACVHEWLSKDPSERPDSFKQMLDDWTGILTEGGRYKIIQGKFSSSVADANNYPKLEENAIYRYFQLKGVSHDIAKQVTTGLFAAGGYRSAGKLDEADQMYNEVLEQFPGFPPALAGKAHSMMLRFNFLAAADLFEDAIVGYGSDSDLCELDDLGFGAALVNFAQVLSQIEVPGVAQHGLELATVAVSILPNDAKSHFTLGMTCLRMGNPSAAYDSISRGLEMDPGSSLGRALLHAIAITPGSRMEFPHALGVSDDERLRAEFLVRRFAALRALDAADPDS